MPLKIEIEVSTQVEGTAAPWWSIIDPHQLMASNDRDACHAVAHMITGPFFSRAAAQRHLENKRHRFGKNAVVFCHSGCDSWEYAQAYNKAEKACTCKFMVPRMKGDDHHETCPLHEPRPEKAVAA